MKSPLMFMRECRNFPHLVLLYAILKIEEFLTKEEAKFGTKFLQGLRGVETFSLPEPTVRSQCMRCAKYFVVPMDEESEPNLFGVGIHECAGDVWAILKLFDDDRWICGKLRSFSDVWVSNKVLFENIGVNEWQAHETRHREELGELVPWCDDDFYSNHAYYAQSWRDDFLDKKLANGYVFDGGIDKYRWAKR